MMHRSIARREGDDDASIDTDDDSDDETIGSILGNKQGNSRQDHPLEGGGGKKRVTVVPGIGQEVQHQ